jgi:Cu/Ag efflux pump CusA
MMDRLIRFSLTNRALVLVAAVILLCFGGYTAMRMPVDVFPDLTAPSVTVITEAHGMAPLVVESQVTLPIESAVNGAPGVRRVRSSTSVGVSVVWAEFDWGTEPHRARQIIGEKLQAVAGMLPSNVEQPVLSPETSIMGEVMFLALTSQGHTPTEMHTFADTVLRRRMLDGLLLAMSVTRHRRRRCALDRSATQIKKSPAEAGLFVVVLRDSSRG